jgi:hypothetical protein
MKTSLETFVNSAYLVKLLTVIQDITCKQHPVPVFKIDPIAIKGTICSKMKYLSDFIKRKCLAAHV